MDTNSESNQAASSKTNVTYERFCEVADRLWQANQPLKIRVLQSLLGGGSNTTLVKHLETYQKHREDQALALASDIGNSELGKMIGAEFDRLIARAVARYKEQIDNQKALVEELTDMLDSHEADYEQRAIAAEQSAQRAIEAANARTQKMQGELTAAMEAKQQAEQDAAVAISNAETKAYTLVEAAQGEVEKVKREMEGLNNELAQLRSANATLSVEAAKVTLFQQQLGDAQSEIGNLNGTITTLRGEAAISTERLASASLQISQQQDQIKLLNEDAKRMRQSEIELASVKAELVQSKASLITAKEDKSRLQGQCDTLSNDVRVAQQEKAQFATRLDDTRTIAHNANNELVQIQRERDHLAQALAALSSKHGEAKPGADTDKAGS